MKIIKKFEITITIDTEKANINFHKFGDAFDRNAYPNWQLNYAGKENHFIENRIRELKDNFKFTGMNCNVIEIN